MKLFCRLILFILILIPYSVKADTAKETVVLLHGIGNNKHSMSSVESFLNKHGYNTINVTYPSTDNNLDGLAKHLRTKHLDTYFWKNIKKVHFVTHSMGGLVARRYLDTYKTKIPTEKLGSVVMLGPPNGGSEVADLLHDLSLYKWFYGPAGNELTTQAQVKNTSEIYYSLGIIAGTKEWPYVITAFVVPGKSDGRVSVKKTKLKGMKDHVTVDATHTFMMHRRDVQEHVLHFLKYEKFK